jgi:membrane protein YqaA with SNARE-associated domain
MDKAKLLIFTHMEKYGFWTILACASIPNPLFDLAGITSGHFRIPFKTFFSATFIGKAIIKVHIQMLFIIVIFRKETLTILIKLIEFVSAGLADSFARGLEAKKKQLNQPE